MKKIAIVIIILILVLSLSLFLFNQKETPFDTEYKKNSIGNEANNLQCSGELAMQGDWFYYRKASWEFLSPDGLYRVKKDGTNKALMAKGHIYNINVVDDYVYYVKIYDDKDDKLLSYFDLYKIRLDGTKNVKLIDNAKNVYVIGDKIYYQIGFEAVGSLENRNIKVPEEQIGKIYTSDLDGKNVETIIDKKVGWFIVYNNFLYYYSLDGSLNRLNLLNFKEEPVITSYFYAYRISNDFIYYYDNKSYKIFQYNLLDNTTTMLLDNIKDVSSINIIDNTLYIKCGGGVLLKLFNIETKEIREYNVIGDIYSFDNVPYVLENDEIYKLDFD